jgi:hypothetical protein
MFSTDIYPGCRQFGVQPDIFLSLELKTANPMSSIDRYKHKILGFIDCPSSYDIMSFNPIRKIPIYELLEDVPLDEEDFEGKAGDLLVDGGSGECAAFQISVPEAMVFFAGDIDSLKDYNTLFKAFWTPTEAFKLCDGFLKMGWPPDEFIEYWLAENLCKLLINELEQYSSYRGTTEEMTGNFLLLSTHL